MKPKVLYLLHMPPPIHGAALVGLQLKNSDIINNEFEGSYINISLAKNMADIGALRLEKITSYFKMLLLIYKTLKKNKFDFCYITPNAKGGAFLKEFIFVMLVKFFKVKVLLHFHTKGVSKKQDNLFYNFLYKRLFKNSKTILLAESLYYDIKKYTKEEDVFYSYVGLSPLITKEHNEKPNDTIQFVFLSNLMIEKGVLVALDACKVLKEKGYKFSFIYAGGETTEMNALILNNLINSYGLQDRVKYVGRLSDDDKNTLLAESDVFVFPTYYHNECFPAAILEAMKNSLAVISTFEGAIPSIITDGETGFLCKQRDVMDLEANMEKFITHPTLALSFGKKGKELFFEKYTNTIFEKRMCSIFKLVERKFL